MTSASCCSGQLCNQFTVPSVKCSTISRCWIILPVLFYILLFLLNPLLKSSAQYSTKGLGQECKLNFIVAADTFLFDRILYRLLPRAEIGTKQPAFPLRILVAVVDFVAGIPYLLHFTLPFVYSAWLMVKKRESITFYQFLLAFGLTCSVGVLVQYALPTPPPWMIPPAKVELSSSATPTFIPLPPEGNFCRIDRILGFANCNDLIKIKHTYLTTPMLIGRIEDHRTISHLICQLHCCLCFFHHYLHLIQCDIFHGVKYPNLALNQRIHIACHRSCLAHHFTQTKFPQISQ